MDEPLLSARTVKILGAIYVVIGAVSAYLAKDAGPLAPFRWWLGGIGVALAALLAYLHWQASPTPPAPPPMALLLVLCLGVTALSGCAHFGTPQPATCEFSSVVPLLGPIAVALASADPASALDIALSKYAPELGRCAVQLALTWLEVSSQSGPPPVSQQVQSAVVIESQKISVLRAWLATHGPQASTTLFPLRLGSGALHPVAVGNW